MNIARIFALFLLFYLAQANAQAISPISGAQSARSEAERMLGALVLVRPLSLESTEALYLEADAHYQRGLHSQAIEAFQDLLLLAPDSIKAWFRVGNLYHQKGSEAAAISAYQKAVDIKHSDSDDMRTQNKALLNISLICLERAGEALAKLEVNTLTPDGNPSEPSKDQARENFQTQLQLREEAQVLSAKAQLHHRKLKAEGKLTRSALAQK
jgi:tetratricopeptide (TPR) repeat protein